MQNAWVTSRSEPFAWGTLAYGHRTGSGPTLVCLHGSGCDAADWESVIRRLPAELGVVCPEFRGHGRSSMPDAPFGIDDLAHDVVELVERLDPGRVVLVGHSLGGMVAKRVAAVRPDRVGAMVMIEGWTHLRAAGQLRHAMFGRLDDRVTRAICDKADATFAHWPPGMRPAFQESLSAFDASAFMARTALPVLELYGDRGTDRPARHALGVPDRPNLRLVWIADAGHYLLDECPAEIVAEIASWMGDRPSRGEP